MARRLSQSITDPLVSVSNKRMSQSFIMEPSTSVLVDEPDNVQEWVQDWRNVLAKDLIEARIVEIDADATVEDACELLLSEKSECLAVRASKDELITGLFDFADVNAFLTLAATRPALLRDEDNPRVDAIVSAARAGRVPVHLVSNLSEKNPLESVPSSATIISLLQVFSRGAHRVLVCSDESSSSSFLGIVSDKRLLTWFSEYEPVANFLATPLSMLQLPSLHLFSMVVTATSNSTVLDAMRLMSEEGVSSVAVLDIETSVLLSAVSVTDVGRIVVPSQSNQILSTPLQQFVALIKAPHGSTDGADRYPVYAVSPQSLLSYTIQKLLATNSHRLFITRDTSGSASPIITSTRLTGNLSGIVSIVDSPPLCIRANGQSRRRPRADATSSEDVVGLVPFAAVCLTI
ncbi:hypothetical protein MIND_00155300 [Mycena indigotica]|uniref:CBS domain-containing protein n=1 Tax=Mycena indigotica TaxID=2126181 RepID=A0A8H6TF41_9AGAR|nr:uncharacterized protein MIND_00155300 [Mycena indigotica]KAF7316365.1 hypothetical protein MIND_00155300 [Mycena indigotica]